MVRIRSRVLAAAAGSLAPLRDRDLIIVSVVHQTSLVLNLK